MVKKQEAEVEKFSRKLKLKLKREPIQSTKESFANKMATPPPLPPAVATPPSFSPSMETPPAFPPPMPNPPSLYPPSLTPPSTAPPSLYPPVTTPFVFLASAFNGFLSRGSAVETL
ncbi:proline-rich protein 3-like [Papaver somniferum]|uniref:proline-rich protein 3-like n=1 Tax=Papaver somniferum TaxID=3469 RepID=UPI000E704CD4|nr:proline-rich protein 3-like [Papaver somniferum]